jgi:hypothetical protein
MIQATTEKAPTKPPKSSSKLHLSKAKANASYKKEIMSDSTRSCSPSEKLATLDFSSNKNNQNESNEQNIQKQYASEKKKRKLTLKELHRQKKVKWKEFDCFKLEKINISRDSAPEMSGKSKAPINFEKCLNFHQKSCGGKSKGTKPINPKANGGMGLSSYSFSNNMLSNNNHEDFGYFAQSQKYKTEICKNFDLKGKCRWGENCCFAHGKAELRKKTLFNYFYKTKICKHFHKNGYCPYASRCQYFHFKTFQKFQELLESFSNKLFLRIKEDRRESLFSILERTGKV